MTRRRSLTGAWRRLAPLAIAATTLACSACGSSNDATITGKIADSAGQPLPDAVVVVGDGQTRAAQVTKHDGTYSIDDQRTGNTPVHVFAPGFIYDPGHSLKSLNSGTNTYDVRLKPQPNSRGPRFSGDPTVTVSGKRVQLQAPIVAGPGSPVGSELLAVDVSDNFALVLTMSGSGSATANVPRSKVSANAQWLFIATDDACQESNTFPSATTPS